MPYIRLSIARARRGEEARLEEIMRKLADASKSEDGCLESYVLKPHDDSGDIARISIYRDQAAGTAAANSDRILALRSEMHLIVEPGHTERAFFTV
jgi:quinol monooxygenase YgiN